MIHIHPISANRSQASSLRRRRRSSQLHRSPKAAGFTLVEMLVAVGLVVLMMTLFATIFQMSTAAMGTQKANAENDQRVRLAMTLLRADLKNRTMLDVGPFAANELVDFAGFPTYSNPDSRKGYVYIGEHDPDDNTDDIFALTISVSQNDDPLYGAARVLLPDSGSSYGPTNPPAPPAPPALAPPDNYWQNQPEFDDQLVGYPDQASSSRTAEVCWFLRRGTLYRRVLLIRSPSVPTASLGGDDHTPTNYPNVSPSSLSTAQYENSAALASVRNFHSDFDFAAFYDTTDPLLPKPRFHGISSLDNGTTIEFPIANPRYRFGHNVQTGLPREFIVNGTNVNFIGRFTQEETSFSNPTGSQTIKLFGYPARLVAGDTPNPMDDATALTVDTTTGRVVEYANGARAGEDVVMTNVLSFDVKVWDEAAGRGPDGFPGVGVDNPATAGVNEADDDGDAALPGGGVNEDDELGTPLSDDGAFVDVGHDGFGFYSNGTTGDYRGTFSNTTYCPTHQGYQVTSGKRQYRFDTWRWNVDVTGDGVADPPPFRAPNYFIGATPYRRPLKAIQIRITFFDPTSRQTRDVTLVQSLANESP